MTAVLEEGGGGGEDIPTPQALGSSVRCGNTVLAEETCRNLSL